MKEIINKIYLAILLLLSVTFLHAQVIDAEIKQMVKGKTKLSEIMREVGNYLNPRIQQNNSNDRYFKQAKLLHRWALYMSNRLDSDGRLTDINKRNFEAFVKARLNMNSNQGTTAASYGNWSFIGPNSVNSTDIRLGIGRVDRITFHPTDPNTIYVGTPAGGVWKTTNDGSLWSAVTSNLPTPGISGIVVHYNDPQILYVLTGDGDSDISGFVEDLGFMRTSTGVYKSTDGGSTWEKTGPLSDQPYTGYRLVQDPNEPNTLLAATSLGVYRTTNGGTTWTLVTAAARFYDLEYDPNNGNRVYAGGNGQVLYSTNSGSTWTAASFNISIANAGRVELAVTPANTAYVYALTGSVTVSGTFSGLYRSTDNGLNFTRRCSTPNIMAGNQAGTGDGTQGAYDLAITVSPVNANRVLTGGVNVWSSTDGGTTMTPIMYDGNGDRKIHVDIHDLAYSPLNGDLYNANDGGMFKSTDNGTSWTKISNRISVSQIYNMAGAPSDQDVLAIGMQDNGIKARTTTTTSFNHNGTGDGYGMAIKNDDVTNGYGGINRNVYTFSLTGGLANENNLSNQWFPPLAIHPTTSSTVYAGNEIVWKSTNSGVSYTSKGGNGSWDITTCPSNTNRVYAAGGSNSYQDDSNGALRRSDNGGDTWTTVFTSANATFSKITSVAVDPSNSANVWITLGGYTAGQKIYRSTNSGGNWTNVSGSLPNIPVNCIAVDADNNAYAGTDFGVFHRRNNLSDWTPYYNSMPRVPVTELIINATGSVIRAATFGRGVWSASLYSACVADLSLPSSYAGMDMYEASGTITSSGNIVGGAGTEVFFRAGNSITLQPGFDATEGNNFRAFIGPCSSGVPGMKYGYDLSKKLPTPDALPFTTNGYIEITSVTNAGCNVQLRLKQLKDATIIVSDEAGNIVYEKQVSGQQLSSSHAVSFNAKPGIRYKALLMVENTLVHWQEIN